MLPSDRLSLDWVGFCSLWKRLGMLHKTATNRERAYKENR